ncbi:MAG: hypothetical protein H6981_04165 [Gammaproteobacteria bacterium]|nr:hypothetical protein [Gammaproteobacteria bacterium]MCP5135976.1 hypothetical protein [Gammaproteobacteria bacterium]
MNWLGIQHRFGINLRLKVFAEFIFVCVLAVTSFNNALNYLADFRLNGGHQFFYQISFEPAVMLACGKGFVVREDLEPVGGDPLGEFLRETSLSFDCQSLEDGLAVTQPKSQQAWFYMLASAAAVWWFAGNVSWATLDALPAMLFALTALGIYGLLRVAGGVVFAAVSVLFFVYALSFEWLSFLHPYYEYLAYMRDFSKAPFIIASVALILWQVIDSRGYKRQLLAVVLQGLILGIGYGFRPDILVMLLPVLVGIVFLVERTADSRFINNLGLAAIFLGSFFLVAWPMVDSAQMNGSCTFHFPLLGLAKVFSDSLGISVGSYDWISQFNDMLVHALVESHGYRNFGLDSIGYCSADYDLVSGDIYKNILATFPADMVTRGAASAAIVLHPFPQALSIVSLSLFLIFLVRPSLGIFVIFLVLYLAGYPAIQFHIRHFFHLNILPVAAIAVLIRLVSCLVKNGFDSTSSIRNLDMGFFKVIGVRVVVLSGIGMSLLLVYWILITIQIGQAQRLFSSYDSDHGRLHIGNFPGGKLGPYILDIGQVYERLFLQIKEDGDGKGPVSIATMLDLEIAGVSCDYFFQDGIGRVTYAAESPAYRFDQPIDLAKFPLVAGDVLKAHIPLFFKENYTVPDSLELNESLLRCVDHVDVYLSVPQSPLWITSVRAKSWGDIGLYQKGFSSSANSKLLLVNPGDYLFGLFDLAEITPTLRSVVFDKPVYEYPGVSITRTDDGRMIFEGVTDRPYVYLSVGEFYTADADSILIVEGELEAGGIAIGLLNRAQAWQQIQSVNRKGPFVIAIKPEPGDYQVVVSQNDQADLTTKLYISRFGWGKHREK